MIYGDNYVEAYSPVEAYSVKTRNSTMISGGTGGEEVVVQGTTFLWVWDPNDTVNYGGFTGGSWLCGVSGTPLEKWTLDQLTGHFQAGNTNLNTAFTEWQNYVNQQLEQGNQFVISDFQNMIINSGGSTRCWATSTVSQ